MPRAPGAVPAPAVPEPVEPADFRQQATLGVALIALAVVVPFAVTSLVQRDWALAIGTQGILLLLAANALCVRRGRRHQEITLYALVPGGMLFMSQVIAVEPGAGALWCYPSIVACYCMLDQRHSWAANAMILVAALPSCWLVMDVRMAGRVTATLVAVSAFAAILVRVIDGQQARLRDQLVTDALTGLANRLPLAAALEGCIAAMPRFGVPAALLAIDLDHFKRVNDGHGHETGDAVLAAAGALLRADDGPGRRAFRTGGEEFLVLLEETDGKAAARAAHALCEAFRRDPLLARHGTTASVGVATLRHRETRTDWLRRADARLYAAKRAGRDRVVADDGDAG